MRRLPDFFVLGAAKAGTTALHRFLDTRPDCALPQTKETHYFSLGQSQQSFSGPGDEDALYHSPLVRVCHTLDDYLDQFPALTSEQLMGEVCPSYLYWPGTAAALHQACPQAKLVAVLRDPAERAFSAYLMLRESGRESEKSFRRALELEPQRIANGWEHAWHYLSMGLYAVQLAAFSEHYPAAAMQVIFYDELCLRPQQVLIDLLGFLGLPAVEGELELERVNRSGLARNQSLDRALRQPFAGKKLLRRLLPQSWRARAGQTLRDRNLERPVLEPGLRLELLDRLSLDTELLEQRLGRPVPWNPQGDSSKSPSTDSSSDATRPDRELRP